MTDPGAAAQQAALTPVLTALRSMAAECRRQMPSAVWTVGFSGGLDSSVLLHGLAQLCLEHSGTEHLGTEQLRAVHIHHGLLAAADEWAEHCVAICQQLAIPLQVKRVEVARDRRGLEAAARHARYAAFKLAVGSGVLWLAHHAQDQAETIVQRLGRGSGATGLAGIPAQRPLASDATVTGCLVRPFLSLTRQQLEAYAEAAGLSWIEDDSNDDLAFDRNWVRHTLLPLWRQRYPQIDQSLCQVAQHQNDNRQLLDEVARADLDALGIDGSSIHYPPLLRMSRARAHNTLRYWLRSVTGYAPGLTVLDELMAGVMGAAAAAQPSLRWQGVRVQRYQHRLYMVADPLPAVPALQPLSLATLQTAPPAYSFGRIVVAAGADDVRGCLFSRTRLSVAQQIQIDFRRGGERIKPHGQATNDLKHWFQRWQVPPWQRGLWPIVRVDGAIAGLPGLCVCAGFAAQSAVDEIALGWQWSLLAGTAD